MLNRPKKPHSGSRLDPSTAARLEKRRKKRRLALKRRIITLAAALTAVAAIAAIIISVTRPSRTPPQPEREEKYIEYWNSRIEVDPGYPASELDPDAFFTFGGRTRYVSTQVRSRQGIDVSEHNGEIDWEAVAADGIEFAMIRVGYRGYTEGAIYEDSCFERNYAGAKAAGLSVGAYFFSQATSVEEAREEAKFVLRALKGYKLDLPLAYDWETIGSENARADDIDRETLTACTKEFCSRVSKSFDAMIYTNAYQGYYLLSLGELADYPIWFAGYADSPIFYYKFGIWQYTNLGRVEGIEGDVDLDIMFDV